MWHHDKRLEEWFEAVKERRRNPDMQSVEEFDVPVMENEFASEIREAATRGD